MSNDFISDLTKQKIMDRKYPMTERLRLPSINDHLKKSNN